MAITEFPPQNPYCYRVYKAWNNKTTSNQLYVPFKQGKRVRKRKALGFAQEIEQKLEERYKAYILKCQITGDDLLKPNGMIKGISIITSKGVEYFQCQIGSRDNVARCTRSFEAYGKRNAFYLVLDFYISVKGITDPEIISRLQDCYNYYDGKNIKSSIKTSHKKNNDLFVSLQAEIDEFVNKTKGKTIAGF
jgi:alpha-amylase/alpha-mannosidase (GH57 family)